MIFHLGKSCQMALPYYGVVSIITRYERQQIKEYVAFFLLIGMKIMNGEIIIIRNCFAVEDMKDNWLPMFAQRAGSQSPSSALWCVCLHVAAVPLTPAILQAVTEYCYPSSAEISNQQQWKGEEMLPYGRQARVSGFCPMFSPELLFNILFCF